MSDENQTDDESEYTVEFWVDAQCFMNVDATSEEEAIEKAKENIDRLYYGDVSPAGEPANFQVRES